MNWIKISVGVMQDPTLHALSEALGVSYPLTTGCLVGVLTCLPQHAPDGDLSTVSDRTIEQWAQWPGKRGKFAAQFRAYLCTPEGVVRSWAKWNGSAQREAQRAPERVKSWREKQAKTPDVTRNVRVTSNAGNADVTRLDKIRVDKIREEVLVAGSSVLPTGITDRPTPLAGGLLLTVAANSGISEAIGEQPTPIRWSQPKNQRAAEAIAAAGVPDDFAAASIHAHAKRCAENVPIHSLGFFVQHVVEQWESHVARTQAASYTPATDPTTQQVDDLKNMAIRYARKGNPEWIGYCTERGYDYGAAA